MSPVPSPVELQPEGETPTSGSETGELPVVGPDDNPGYGTFGVFFGAVFCCVGAVVRVLKLGWPGFMGGQKVCLGSGFFVVVPRDKSV